MVQNIAIISLSRGIVGEAFVQHEVVLGLKRLENCGVNVKFTDHAQRGLRYIADHPEKRAEDLLNAFRDDSVDMILCAIGGDDTYRLLPYLFEEDALKQAINKKVFLGFSDSTMNHFMLHKVGMPSFYGQAFLPDLCEMAPEMLPYTRKYFEELLQTGTISEIRPSDVWYEERTQWDESQMGIAMEAHENQGFRLLQGSPVFRGKILGGCIDTIYDMFNGDRYPDSVELCKMYSLFPKQEDWKGKILLLETSEEKAPPEKYRKMLLALKSTGIFHIISGILVGKPQNQVYAEEYEKILVEVVDDPALPILANLNVGHATPRCIIPFGITALVDGTQQKITFEK